MSSQSNQANMNEQDFSIFVGGLSNSVTSDCLNDYFRQFGEILSCEAQMWKTNPNKCRGFAILQAENKETYDRILKSNHILTGRVIECKKMIHDKRELEDFSKDQIERKIFVSGLPKSVDDIILTKFFSQFGEVKMAYVVKHHKDQKSKGFGYVCYTSKEVKEQVLRMKMVEFNGKVVNLTEYSTKLELKTKKTNPAEDSNLRFNQATAPYIQKRELNKEAEIKVVSSTSESHSRYSGSSDKVFNHTRTLQTLKSEKTPESTIAIQRPYNPFLGVFVNNSKLTNYYQ